MPERKSLLSVPEDFSLSFSGRKNRKAVDHSELDDLLEDGEHNSSSERIRVEVESLVRKFLPDEVDNLDEMLEEFHGREGELLSTLRKMQAQSNGGKTPENERGDMGENEGENGGFDMDRWGEDLDNQLGDSTRSESDSEPQPQSNPQGGTLKSPPEQLIADEKKNDSPPENDVGLPNELPDMVRTNSLGHLKVSALSTQSSLDGTETSSVAPAGKKTVALVKLRVWDPAKPRGRVKCLTTAQIILPNENELSPRDANASDARKAAMQRTGERKKRLSIVDEEPEIPHDRGDSFYDKTSSHSQSNIEKLLSSEEDDGGDSDKSGPGEESHSKLCVGTLIGMQLRPSSSSSSSKQQFSSSVSVASTWSVQRNYEWKSGSPINLHKSCILPLTNLPELHYQVENNYSSLRELVMDGLSPSSLPLEEAELIFEALGSNTSVKRLSMRYSNVEDGLASLFALALVDNTTITHLSLEGNEMTNVSAKNFYSVLKKNNETLRLLDLSKNPIDEDVEQALDQFMEQRALKRTLTNKAEKAKRAARGMPPDSTLDDDDDEGDDILTLVCPQSVIDGELQSGEGNNTQDSSYPGRQLPQDEYISSESLDASDRAKPLPGESFRDYMLRMDQVKEKDNRSPEYLSKLMNESMREREAFENYGNNPHLTRQHPSGNVSTAGSSISSRSAPKTYSTLFDPQGEPQRRGAENDGIITLSSNNVAASPGQSKRNIGAQAINPSPHPYHNTQVSTGSNPSLQISEEDYRNDKADERAIRRQLATEGAIGAFHMDEAAPSRQNRAAGGGGRRGRMGRTESQRRARLAELQGGGGGGAAAAARDAEIYDADVDIERADDDSYLRNMDRKKSFLPSTDRIIMVVMALLLVGLLIMIVLIVIL